MAIYEGGHAGQTRRWAKWVERVSQVKNVKARGGAGVGRRLGRKRTALVSKVSIGLHVRADVVRDGFKFAQDILHPIDNAFIL